TASGTRSFVNLFEVQRTVLAFETRVILELFHAAMSLTVSIIVIGVVIMTPAAAGQIAYESDHVVFFEVGIGFFVVGMQVQRFLHGERRFPAHGGLDRGLAPATAPSRIAATATARVPAPATWI